MNPLLPLFSCLVVSDRKILCHLTYFSLLSRLSLMYYHLLMSKDFLRVGGLFCSCSLDVLFADDTLISARAIRQESDTLSGVLQSYTQTFGQAIYFQKSHVFFSKHTPPALKHNILQKFHMQEMSSSCKYLGLPIFFGCSG